MYISNNSSSNQSNDLPHTGGTSDISRRPVLNVKARVNPQSNRLSSGS